MSCFHADTMEKARIFLNQKRLNSVPDKFRVANDSDKEIAIQQNKRRKVDAKVVKQHKQNAKKKNIDHLKTSLKSTKEPRSIKSSRKFSQFVILQLKLI